MSCPNNPKVFWIFKYDGPCLYKDSYVRKAMTSGAFHVTQTCELCKSSRDVNFVSQQSMIRSGYDTDKLSRMSAYNIGSSPDSLR